MSHDTCAPTRRAVYSLNFILTTIVAATTYFNTPLLLSRGVPESAIGLVYALAALMTIGFLALIPRLFSAYGSYYSLQILGFSSMAAMLGIAFVPNLGATILLFIVLSVAVAAAGVLLDVILEGSTAAEQETGSTRGLYLTMANLAWFIAPAIAGLLSADGSFMPLFLASALMIIPIMSVAAYSLRTIRNHHYPAIRPWRTLARIRRDSNIMMVFAAQFLLRLFFTLMVIYIPIYLTKEIGMSLANLGLILSYAMAAYLIVEWPAGRLGDHALGEKELMALGFFIAACATATLSIAHAPLIWIWAIILFVSRIGAAILDIMTESYFFKHVDGGDADLVSAFRMLGPLAYIVGPIMGSVLLLFTSVGNIFALLALVMLFGIPIALSLEDTQ